MEKINTLLQQLRNLYQRKYYGEEDVDDSIKNLENKMIHPDDGAYFIIVIRFKNSTNKKWHLLTYTLFQSKEDAEIRLKQYISIHKNNGNIDDVEIKITRASIFETDIQNVL